MCSLKKWKKVVQQNRILTQTDERIVVINNVNIVDPEDISRALKLKITDDNIYNSFVTVMQHLLQIPCDELGAKIWGILEKSTYKAAAVSEDANLESGKIVSTIFDSLVAQFTPEELQV